MEVDLVGVDAENRGTVAFAGSINWRERSGFDINDLEVLRRVIGEVPRADLETPLVGISQAGFAPALDGLAAGFGPADHAWATPGISGQ